MLWTGQVGFPKIDTTILLQSACSKEYEPACVEIAVRELSQKSCAALSATMSQSGISEKPDYSHNLSILATGCDHGLAAACYYLTRTAYLNPELVNRHSQINLLQKACDRGLIDGCLSLAHELEMIGDKNAQAAFKKTAEMGFLGAYSMLAKSLIKNGEFINAIKYYKLDCEKGWGEACTELGKFYDEGIHIKRSLKLATKYYSLGCNQSSEAGCAALTEHFGEAHPHPSDKEKEYQYYEDGCHKASAPLCLAAAMMLQAGEIGIPDYPAALSRFETACHSRALPEACYRAELLSKYSFMRGYYRNYQLDLACPENLQDGATWCFLTAKQLLKAADRTRQQERIARFMSAACSHAQPEDDFRVEACGYGKNNPVKPVSAP